MLTKVVPIAWLERVMRGALASRGLSEADQGDVASGILFASLRGIDTHGIALFRTYLHELESGRARCRPHFEYQQRRPAIARLDGGGALGIVAGFEATRKAASLAKENGVGIVVVANSNHFGAASIFTTALAREGLIGVALSNSDALVLPVNGRVPLMGTNPISMAVCGGGNDVFCTDLATSQGSFLHSLALRAEGKPLPPAVLADVEGLDVVASGEAPAALLPLGGHKGQCLGMMVSILCAVLGDAPFDWEVANLFEGSFDTPRQISHLVLGIDIGAVTDRERFRTRLSRYLTVFRETSARPGLTVSCPGDIESERARRRTLDGVPISLEDHAFLCGLARP